jgi:hypothetical protein
MHLVEVFETPDGFEVAVLDVAGYIVEPEVFPTAEEANAWAAKLIAAYESELENPPESLEAYHFANSDGRSFPVCRIEFVLLGEGKYQFNLWSRERRLHTEVGHLNDLEEHLRLTALFLDTQCEGDLDELDFS